MLIVVSKCPQCGCPIYGPESVHSEENVITVKRTCVCVPLSLSYALPMTTSWPATTPGLTPPKL